MTRQEILDAYSVDSHGIITSPGKFEAEMIFAPHFYDASLDMAERLDWNEGEIVYIVELDASDREQFPELDADTVAVAIEESDQGFVGVTELTQDKLDKLRADCDVWQPGTDNDAALTSRRNANQ